MSPSPNVAIVSPMPSAKRPEHARTAAVGKEEELKKEEQAGEDPMQGIAPMAPLGLFRQAGRAETAGHTAGAGQTVNTAVLGKRYSLGANDCFCRH